MREVSPGGPELATEGPCPARHHPIVPRAPSALLALAALLVATTSVGGAHANGRFPAAQQLVQAPGDPAHLVAQVTYGLVSTRNAGATWEWTCEVAMGSVEAFDPPVQMGPGGVVFAAMLDGLGRSSPDGCSWSFVAGDAAGRFVVDVSVTKGVPDDVLFLTTDGAGVGAFDTRLFRSGDGGQTFAQVGSPFPSNFIGATLDVAPSDPDRVYVSGFLVEDGGYAGAVGRSEDGGESFALEPVPGTDANRGPFLAAIDPVDPSVVYVRTTGDGGQVLRSADGGASWDVLFQGAGSLAGFALSPDGATILVGGVADPIHRGPAAGGVFEVVSEVRPRCLAWFEDAVYACGSEAIEGFTIGRSVDEGATFEGLYSRFCTAGPIDCPDGTSIGDLCDAEWEVLRETIEADACFTAGSGGAGGIDSQGTGSSVSVAAATSAAATNPSGSGGGAPLDAAGSSGCCTVAAGARPTGDPWGAFAFALGLGIAAARRGPTCGSSLRRGPNRQ